MNFVHELLEQLPYVHAILAGDGTDCQVITKGQNTPIEVGFGRAAIYAAQVEARAQHQGWCEFSVPPEKVDEASGVCRSLGLFPADVNVSGPRVQIFWIRGEEQERWRFPNWLGRKFTDGTDVNAGKNGLKRMRVLKLPGLAHRTSGGNVVPGRAVSRSRQGYDVHTVSTPAGKLSIAEVPCPHDANDNDALVTPQAYRILAELCDLDPDPGAAATVQALLVSSTGAIKFAGQMLTRDPAGTSAAMLRHAPEADIYVGPSGVDRKVKFTGKVAVRANIWEEKSQTGLVPADGLQQAATVLGYLTPATVARHTNTALSAMIRRDQLATFDARADWEVPMTRDENPITWSMKDLLIQIQRRNLALLAQSTGQAAWEANGSRFAYADPQSASAKAAYALRSYVENNQRGQHGGMPSLWLPGYWVKLTSAMFAGDSLFPVEEPEPGWATLTWRREDQPYGLVINSADFGSQVWLYASDGSDFDDKLTASLTVDQQGDPWLLVMRRPASPYGGMLLRVTRQEAAEYERRTGTPAMPLREGWQEYAAQCRDYAELPNAVDLGPELEPIPASNDLAEVLAAARRQAEQVGWTGKVSYLVGALYLSDMTRDGSVKFVTSDLIDNAVEGKHDGAHVYLQFLDAAVDRVRARQPFWRPSVSVIESSILERYEERYGETVTMRYCANPELDELWQQLQQQAVWSWQQHATLTNRRNGPYQWLNGPVPDTASDPARQAVEQARDLWSRWGRAKQALPYKDRQGEAMAAITDATTEAIRSAVQAAYEQASADSGYRPGTFIAALKQAQAVEARYWQRFDRKRTAKRYELIEHLPRKEQVAYFDRNGLPPADPTWLARTWPLRGQELQPWDEVVVRRHNGGYFLFRDDAPDGPPVAQLGAEAQGIVQLYSEFLGFLPRRTGEPPVAAYRNSAKELEQLTRAQLTKAQDLLEGMRKFV